MAAKGVDMEALSPRDANAQRGARAPDLKVKAAAGLKTSKEKEHPPPPPPNVTEPPSADRKEGAVYQVEKLLGKGGFAVCYEARLAGSRKKYALKIVKRQMPSKMEQKFQTELQIHSKMKQQNIVQFFRAFTFENSTYLVLELCPNGSLMDLVKRRKGLTEPEVRFYTVQIAGAIKYMHAKGIIHRDLKMGNIFLDKHMNAKIGDFGLAALLVTGKDMHTIRRTTLCGTPNYIAPEILEKGKKGHDHMVDIWSLGIIVFAMLTSKPPFQSSTTDEIYRRAREREYVWPDTEVSQKNISEEAKALVATMLVEADRRPEPDTVVQHSFFMAGYMPVSSDMTSRLRESPPEPDCFYQTPTETAIRARNFANLKALCEECGVGPWVVGRVVHTPTWREVHQEENAGLSPVIPLAEGIVYRPFEDWQRENGLQNVLAPPMALSSQGSEKAPESTTQPQKAPSGLLRAPPQSFAAQQRAQSRPLGTNNATLRSLQPPAPEPASAITGAYRSRAKRVFLTKTGVQASEENAAPAPKINTRSLRNQIPSIKSPPAPEPEIAPPAVQQSATPKPYTPEGKISLFSPSDNTHAVPGTRPDVVLQRLRKLQAELERALNARSMALLSTKEKAPPLPHIVVKWVDYSNKFGLGYVLNDGSIGCALRQIPVNDPPQKGILPPAFILVHGGERHLMRKGDPKYRDRQQLLPMAEAIYFYESSSEDGLTGVCVPGENFRVHPNPDGTLGKIGAGKDIYEHRKRERVVLWKKFANYMVAYGREIEGSPAAEEAPMRMVPVTNPAAAPSDVVSFYQRFGDVGCWMFTDGHLQFNFPDHTKVVLDSTGTWCHFWHLPQAAAEGLAKNGTLEEAALDDRTVLSYPVQTLLNFATVPKQPSLRAGIRSTSGSSRRRPEISPELQGIPAANDFRRKIEFIRSVVKEWTTNGGIGRSDMSRDGRLRWQGVRETKFVQPAARNVWVTIGASGGDDGFWATGGKSSGVPVEVATAAAAAGGGGSEEVRKRSA